MACQRFETNEHYLRVELAQDSTEGQRSVLGEVMKVGASMFSNKLDKSNLPRIRDELPAPDGAKEAKDAVP